MTDVWNSPCGRMELRLGRWQDVLADVERCDAVITDPPYSERTHSGQRSLKVRSTAEAQRKHGPVASIAYEAMGADPVPRYDSGWYVIFSDHAGWIAHETEMKVRGLYVFQPVPWIKTDPTPRFSGDGPTSAAEYLCVARKTSRDIYMGSRKGAYVGLSAGPAEGISLVGRKPIWLMRELVSDYSRRGDLIVDPYAGSGTTLLAAAMEGRRCIGAEMDPKTFALAVKRLSKGYTESLFREPVEAKQEPLL